MRYGSWYRSQEPKRRGSLRALCEKSGPTSRCSRRAAANAVVDEEGRRTRLAAERQVVGQTEVLDVVEQPIELEVILSMKTAHALGLTVPTSLLLWSDQVID